MKIILIIIFLIISQSISCGDDVYTSRKGTKLFPGHLDIVITIEEDYLRYELFNHWYTSSYAELRQISIPIDSIASFNHSNDSISISISDTKVHLIDKRYNIKKVIRHKDLCTSPEDMRKISFAYEISINNDSINHYDLYDTEDLNLTEQEFKEKVIEKLNSIR
jgi:hypothetical protein